MLRPSPNHGTQRLPNDDDDDELKITNGRAANIGFKKRGALPSAAN